jgi:hypothetical protein
MSWDDFKSTPTNVKDNTYRSVGQKHFYCIFRIGNKLKVVDGSMKNTLLTIKNFQKHMEREMEVPNANTKIENEILIGNKNIYGIVQEYIKDVKLRSNGVLARELLMTASPDFFKILLPGELERWKADNMKFLEKTFGTNCVYATMHIDEKTPHIHALIVPRFTNKKGEYVLSNKRYFDGIQAYREFQDNYAATMQEHFKVLNRGIKYSKAKHLTIRQYYTLINQSLNEKDISQVLAKAKNSELLEIKIKAIEKTLQVYKNYNSKNEKMKESAILESKGLLKEIEKMKGEKETYKEALSFLSQKFRIPQYVIKEAVREVEAINEKEK